MIIPFPTEWKNKKCSKPPLSIDLPLGFLTLEQSNTDNLKSPKAARGRTSWHSNESITTRRRKIPQTFSPYNIYIYIIYIYICVCVNIIYIYIYYIYVCKYIYNIIYMYVYIYINTSPFENKMAPMISVLGGSSHGSKLCFCCNL